MRNVRICSISLPGVETEEGHLKKVLTRASSWINLAAKDEPDIICLPETVNGLGLSGDKWAKCAEEVPGPTTNMFSRKAAEYSIYIVCPIIRKDPAGLHNSAILYDRSGDLAAIYDKVHPTISEIEGGIIPGERGQVFDTDFGRVGFAICFDLNFGDLREFYKHRHVDLIVFPSMFRGGIQLKFWAYEIGCYLLSATPGEQSAIVNPLGRILEESYAYNRIISQNVNLDFSILHLDYNFEKLEKIKVAYGPAVEFEVASPEGIFLLFSWHDKRKATQIVREFDLETREEYFRRSKKIREGSIRSRAKG